MKKSTLLMLIVGGLVLSLACQSVVNLVDGSQPVSIEPTAEPTEASVGLMNTPAPSPVFDQTQVLVTATSMGVPSSTAIILQSPGLPPAATEALQGCVENVSISVNDTDSGDFLHVSVCSDGEEYDIGPLPKGVYAIGPNEKFIVYVTSAGDVYAVRIGETRLTPIGDVRDFLAVRERAVPQFELEFFGNHPYTVQIRELDYSQDKTLSIPRFITAP